MEIHLIVLLFDNLFTPHNKKVTAVNSPGKTRSNYSATGLAKLDASLVDRWDKSRVMESEAVNDLEKHLWLANGAAATMSIGFIQAKQTIPVFQYMGAWSFVSGVLLLVVLKFLSAWISSRERFRFQDAKSRFDADEVTDLIFCSVRDGMHRVLYCMYLALQWGAGIAFIAGCILTLVGINAA